MIILDNSLLSLAYRRRWREHGEPTEVTYFRKLVSKGADFGVPGIVLQELLSGLRPESEVKRLRGYLQRFQILLATEDDHVGAARIANACRGRGATVAAVDCLIASQTIRTGGALWTLDRDFAVIAQHSSLTLFRSADNL